MQTSFNRAMLVALSVAPTLAVAVAASMPFDALQRSLAQTWSATGGDCANPVPSNPLETDDQVAAVKIGLKTYQACLKAAVSVIQARKSAQVEVGADRWAALDDSQRAALQQTLDAANREAVRKVLDEGVRVASSANFAFKAYDNKVHDQQFSQQVSLDVARIRACGPRYKSLMERKHDLDRDREPIDRLQGRLNSMLFAIEASRAIVATGHGNNAQLNNQIAEYNRQNQQHQILAKSWNSRS